MTAEGAPVVQYLTVVRTIPVCPDHGAMRRYGSGKGSHSRYKCSRCDRQGIGTKTENLRLIRQTHSTPAVDTGVQISASGGKSCSTPKT